MMVQAQFEKNFEGWRNLARQYLAEGVHPDFIHWNQQELSLFQEIDQKPKSVKNGQRFVPAKFIELASAVSYARDENRWDLLYRILFRLQHENPNLLNITVDTDIMRAELLKKSVKRDIHKMHAFVRFKKGLVNGNEIYLAWHRPEHLIVRAATPFFARRFGDKAWSIFTPEESAHWDLENLTFGAGMELKDFKTTDDWDEIWKTYYKSIFNPARIKIKAMKLEMATKYWSSMPETTLIHELIREAPKRLQTMALNQNRAAEVDQSLNITQLKIQAQSCKACPLYSSATQTVFGVGPENAKIMIIGEQPGDLEDTMGLPFVGPAGEILSAALAAAGIRKEDVYLTNAVKHFKWTRSGKLRKHQKASGSEMHACKPWLEAEIAKVKPQVIIALGVTAATAVTGKLPKIKEERGRILNHIKAAPAVIITWHPASILRSSTDEESAEKKLQLLQDIRLAIESLK